MSSIHGFNVSELVAAAQEFISNPRCPNSSERAFARRRLELILPEFKRALEEDAEAPDIEPVYECLSTILFGDTLKHVAVHWHFKLGEGGAEDTLGATGTRLETGMVGQNPVQ